MLYHHLFVLILLMSLGACASAPAPPPPSSPVPAAALGTATPNPTATARPTPLLPSPTPLPRPLTLWLGLDEAALPALEPLIQELLRAEGLTLDVVSRPPDALRLSLATARLLGEPLPDLIWADQEALAGLLADDALQPLPADVGLADALPALLTAASLDGERWGAPLTAQNSLLLLYNRDLIADPPTTTNALITLARTTQTREVTGLVMAWNEVAWAIPWLHAFGGALTSPDGQTITLDTPAMTPTLSLLRELYTVSSEGSANYLRAQRLFAQGYAALLLDGDWALPRYRAVSDTLRLGIAPLPRPDAAERAPVALLGGSFLMLSSSVTEADMRRLLDIISVLAGPVQQLRLAAALGHLPASRAALANLAPETDPALLITASSAPAAPGLPPTAAARCARYGLAVWLPSVYSGRLALDQAPATMQREAEACLQREQ